MKIKNQIFYFSDIKTLLPGKWLNDKIINFYYELLSEVYTKTYFFNTFAYLQIKNSESEEDLKVYFSDIDFSKYDTFIFPIHTVNHWSAVKITQNRIMGLDSLGTVSRQVLDLINWFYMNFILENYDEEKDLIELKEIDKYVPKQTNCDDCGVYCCMFAKYFATSKLELEFPVISTRKLRFRMIHEILAGKIIYFPD